MLVYFTSDLPRRVYSLLVCFHSPLMHWRSASSRVLSQNLLSLPDPSSSFHLHSYLTRMPHTINPKTYSHLRTSIYHPSPNPDTKMLFPLAYTPLALAGTGTKATVYTSLPTSLLPPTLHFLSLGGSAAHLPSILLPRVVAVKIPLSRSPSLRQEIQILLAIRRQSHLYKGSGNCLKLLGYDMGPEPGWLVMSTTPLCLNLSVLCSRLTGPMPKAMLWATITQLYSAFWFLHRICVPPVTHRDVGLSNFTISYSSRGLEPKITLIDFGTAREGQGQRDDVENFCYEIKELVLACGLENFEIGKERVERFMRIWGDVGGLEQLWLEMGGFAEEQCELLGEQEWDGVREVVEKAARVEGVLERAVRGLLLE
jgi:hypothetical protein